MVRWLVAGGIATLAMIGVWTVVNVVADWAGRVRYWLRDRVTPLLEDFEGTGVLCAGCIGFEHCDGQEGACDCTCGWPEGWAEEELPPLPPERTWEEMTSHQLPIAEGAEESQKWLLQLQRSNELSPQRERRAPWWEAEHRAAYEAMGFDYPSGLMERVRELTP